MSDVGVLLSLPLESVAVRAIITSVAAVLAARLLLRTSLRSPGARVTAALVPALGLVATVALCWGSLRLPAVMIAVDAVEALPVPVRDGYLHFAPLALPVLVGLWAIVASVRIAGRLRRFARMRSRARDAFAAGASAPRRVRRAVTRLARASSVDPPPVAAVPRCPGGATVVGIRRPVIVIDLDLAEQMDDEELEGILAHELAHVRRRDNLTALLVGIVRDLAFFVPGGRWTLRQLLAERERAADAAAVRQTGRPGALASGLLRVVEGPAQAETCAALVPTSDVVGRVQTLVADEVAVTRLRGGSEVLTVGVLLAAAVAAGVQVPSIAAGSTGERDAVALLWSEEPEARDTGPAETRVFQVYRDAPIAATATDAGGSTVTTDDPTEVRRSTLRACAAGHLACPDGRATSLGLRARPRIRTDEALTAGWRASPLVTAEDGFGVYIFERLR